jgi:lipoprotein-anchoring transpeptidase ErfK/SrfK
MIRIATLTLALAVVGVPSIAASPIQAATFERQADAVSNRAQPLLLIDQRVTARAHPSPRAGIVGRVETRTPLTGAPTVLPILQTAHGPAGGRWLRVRLPMRPNSASGWVPADTGKVTTTPWRIIVHLNSHRALVLRNGKIRASYPIVIGHPGTPTPRGAFFVVEKIRVAPGVTIGPWALATSAYSNVLYEFAGGQGQVALHGTVGLSAPLGTSASHGCVRFGNDAITWIATHVGNGTPLVIQP